MNIKMRHGAEEGLKTFTAVSFTDRQISSLPTQVAVLLS
ncbi:hypothetical protein E2C01_023478 [Portunus trituberculatus]|uniref:Uncharacterized protein n=1 Tax=Portunus trituberculatus TaxID=210409 RepID=A0A5B7E8X5_PORTR|nr:hypothetical protein [Portunus trituberculatus]